MATLGRGSQAPGHYALGHALLMLGAYGEAQEELEKAWAASFQGPDVAWSLARAMVGAAHLATNQAIFVTGIEPPGSGQVAQRVQELFRRSKGAQGATPDITDALAALASRDYRRAAASARAALDAHPWQFEAASVESLARSDLGRELYNAGDLQGAEASFRAAMAAAERFLAVGHSDDSTYHTYFVAAGRLAFLQATQGRLRQAFLDALQTRCEQAMGLDPARQEFLDDWLLISLARAYRLRDLGRDPGPVLEAALAFLDQRAHPPLAAELLADRMLLRWQLAECRFRRGENPDPDLAEVMNDLGRTSFFRHRDLLVEILNFKARVEMSRGQDPRPTLADALRRMQPLLQQRASWSLLEAAAESWLMRAEWEAGHGLDATASLQRSRALVDLALHIHPGSGTGHALKGLTIALEMRLRPAERPLQLAAARNELHRAVTLGPAGSLQILLRQSLAANAAPEVGRAPS
jgi:tetratricopeptide (TPR) repeat protein